MTLPIGFAIAGVALASLVNLVPTARLRCHSDALTFLSN